MPPVLDVAFSDTAPRILMCRGSSLKPLSPILGSNNANGCCDGVTATKEGSLGMDWAPQDDVLDGTELLPWPSLGSPSWLDSLMEDEPRLPQLCSPSPPSCDNCCETGGRCSNSWGCTSSSVAFPAAAASAIDREPLVPDPFEGLDPSLVAITAIVPPSYQQQSLPQTPMQQQQQSLSDRQRTTALLLRYWELKRERANKPPASPSAPANSLLQLQQHPQLPGQQKPSWQGGAELPVDAPTSPMLLPSPLQSSYGAALPGLTTSAPVPTEVACAPAFDLATPVTAATPKSFDFWPKGPQPGNSTHCELSGFPVASPTLPAAGHVSSSLQASAETPWTSEGEDEDWQADGYGQWPAKRACGSDRRQRRREQSRCYREKKRAQVIGLQRQVMILREEVGRLQSILRSLGFQGVITPEQAKAFSEPVSG